MQGSLYSNNQSGDRDCFTIDFILIIDVLIRVQMVVWRVDE